MPLLNIEGWNYGGPSEKLFALYASEAEKHDRAMIQGWNADMKGILFFVSIVI
jgi:hypothetical protein